MKTFELRSLFKAETKAIDPPQKIKSLLKIWKKLFSDRVGREPNELDCFYAGYVLANPILAEKFKELSE